MTKEKKTSNSKCTHFFNYDESECVICKKTTKQIDLEENLKEILSVINSILLNILLNLYRFPNRERLLTELDEITEKLELM